MARTYTKEQLDSMFGEAKRLALEIDSMEAEMENKAPANPPVKPEIQKELPAVSQTTEVVQESPAPEPAPAPEPQIQDLEFWKKKAEETAREAEKAEKRRKDAESHLTPVQQEAARLRKENSALEDQVNNLSKKLDEVLSQIRNNHAPSTPTEDILDTDFPDVAQGINARLARLKEELKAEAIREAQAALKKDLVSQEDFRSLQSRLEAEQDAAEARKHFLEVQTAHKDAGLFFDDHALRPAFAEWAATQSPEYEKVVHYPRTFTPRFVSSVITQFKHDTGMMRKAEQPSLGDRVARAMASPNVAAIPEEKTDEFFSDSELANFDDLQRRFRNDPSMQLKLIEKLERSLKRKQQTR